jgi:hypothetical protein
MRWPLSHDIFEIHNDCSIRVSIQLVRWSINKTTNQSKQQITVYQITNQTIKPSNPSIQGSSLYLSASLVGATVSHVMLLRYHLAIKQCVVQVIQLLIVLLAALICRPEIDSRCFNHTVEIVELLLCIAVSCLSMASAAQTEHLNNCCLLHDTCSMFSAKLWWWNHRFDLCSNLTYMQS